MVIQDSFMATEVGLVVTGRPEAGDIEQGEQMVLEADGGQYQVTVLAMRRMCARGDGAWNVAREGENIGLVIDGVPKGLSVVGSVLWS